MVPSVPYYRCVRDAAIPTFDIWLSLFIYTAPRVLAKLSINYFGFDNESDVVVDVWTKNFGAEGIAKS